MSCWKELYKVQKDREIRQLAIHHFTIVTSPTTRAERIETCVATTLKLGRCTFLVGKASFLYSKLPSSNSHLIMTFYEWFTSHRSFFSLSSQLSFVSTASYHNVKPLGLTWTTLCFLCRIKFLFFFFFRFLTSPSSKFSQLLRLQFFLIFKKTWWNAPDICKTSSFTKPTTSQILAIFSHSESSTYMQFSPTH